MLDKSVYESITKGPFQLSSKKTSIKREIAKKGSEFSVVQVEPNWK